MMLFLRNFLRPAIFTSLFFSSVALSAQEEPFDEDGWNELIEQGDTAVKTGDILNAIAHYEHALAFDPEGPDKITNEYLLGLAFLLNKNADEAFTHFAAVLDTAAAIGSADDGQFRELINYIGQVLAESGSDEVMARIYQKSADMDYANPDWTMDGETHTFYRPAAKALIPNAVGVFTRRKISFFEREWDDFAAQYRIPDTDNDIFLTLYVTEHPQLSIKQHFSDALDAIKQRGKSVKKLGADAYYQLPGREDLQGAYGKYRAKFDKRKVGTEVLIFKIDDWYYKLRATYDWKMRKSGEKMVAAFIEEFPWPKPDISIINVKLTKMDGKVCKGDLEQGRVINQFNSTAGTLGIALSYIAYKQEDYPSRPKKQHGFCLAERFRVNGQVVTAYYAKKPAGKDRVHYRFEIGDGEDFIRFANSQLLVEVVEAEKRIKINGTPLHIDYYTKNRVTLVATIDVEKTLPYSIARKVVIQQLTEKPLGLADAEVTDDEGNMTINLHSLPEDEET